MTQVAADNGPQPRRTGRVVLCGPSRDSVSGVATHLNQLFGSSLAQDYTLLQFQVGSEGRSEGLLRKSVRYLTSPLDLAITINRFKPDIVHLNSSFEPKAYWRDLIYLLIARMSGCRVVFQVHGGELPSRFLGRNRWMHAFLRWSLALPDVLVLLAEIERKEYQDFNAGRRILVIPNAIDLAEYDSQTTKTFDHDPFRLGYIGRLAEDKGIREVIEALIILRKEGIANLHLTIAGSGPYEAELIALVEQAGMADRVEFIGAVFGRDKLRFWNSIEIFTFPTYHREGLPYTVLEALASGTPQITTPVGGIPDVVRNGVEGLVIDSHDPQSIARAIRELQGDPERLRDMSQASIMRAHENYGVARLAQQFDGLYQELLA